MLRTVIDDILVELIDDVKKITPTKDGLIISLTSNDIIYNIRLFNLHGVGLLNHVNVSLHYDELHINGECKDKLYQLTISNSPLYEPSVNVNNIVNIINIKKDNAISIYSNYVKLLNVTHTKHYSEVTYFKIDDLKIYKVLKIL